MVEESGDNEVIQRRSSMTKEELDQLEKISLINEVLVLQDERKMLWTYLETYRAENKMLGRINEKSAFKRRIKSKYIRRVKT